MVDRDNVEQRARGARKLAGPSAAVGDQQGIGYFDAFNPSRHRLPRGALDGSGPQDRNRYRAPIPREDLLAQRLGQRINIGKAVARRVFRARLDKRPGGVRVRGPQAPAGLIELSKDRGEIEFTGGREWRRPDTPPDRSFPPSAAEANGHVQQGGVPRGPPPGERPAGAAPGGLQRPVPAL